MNFYILLVVLAVFVFMVVNTVHEYSHPLSHSYGYDPVKCYEDEVIAWDGDAHTVCVNLDEIDAYYEERFGS